MNVRWLVVLGGVVPLGIVFACGKEAPPPETPKVEPPAAIDAAPALVDAAPPPPPPPIKAEPALLPSGDYEITTEVKKDTCSKADGGASAPDAVTLFVQMKVWHDKSGKERVTGNFPLPLPRAKGFGSARSDIVLLPPPSGENEHASVLKGMGSQCPEYETKTLYKVLEQTESSVKVEYTRDYGDASKCPPKAQPPSKCSLDYVYTFKLVNKVCDAHCGVTFAKGADGGLGPKCQSCDGGAP
jgi:hypothetical protein